MIDADTPAFLAKKRTFQDRTKKLILVEGASSNGCSKHQDNNDSPRKHPQSNLSSIKGQKKQNFLDPNKVFVASGVRENSVASSLSP
jgi:hypothetical protein